MIKIRTLFENWWTIQFNAAHEGATWRVASEAFEAGYKAAQSQHEPEVRLTEMSLKAKEGEPFEATGQFQGDAVKEWALAMVQSFREKGGVNYIACDLSDPTTGERYSITMQKAGGRTPAQDLAELRSQLNRQVKP